MGKFWAIGVGPGDPGLLTLKAVEILRRVQVIYHPGPKPDRGRAWDIVHSYLRPDQEVRILLMESMASASASDGKKPYQSAVDRIATDCRAGKDVALITEGDPTLYSTAANVWQLLQERHADIPIEVVPGVSSITAAASAGALFARGSLSILVATSSTGRARAARNATSCTSSSSTPRRTSTSNTTPPAITPSSWLRFCTIFRPFVCSRFPKCCRKFFPFWKTAAKIGKRFTWKISALPKNG